MLGQPTSTIPSDARAVLTINLDALRGNWARLNQASGRAECAGVIKADAYGLGLEQIVSALRDGGCETFFCASIGEAQRVRMVVPGAAVYVLDGLLPGAAPAYSGFDLRPCLASMAEVREWVAYCDATGRKLRAAINIDTGMNRLGMQASEVAELASEPTLLERFDCSLIMSHLACADERTNPMNWRQKARFDELRALLPPIPASLANSGGVFLGPDYHYDLVRPGIALYGGRAVDGEPNPMDWVVQLQARILQVRDCAVGETVGYGAAFRCDRPTRVATIACGYADGFLRAISRANAHGGAVGFLDEHPVPIIGRVSMDLITVDVSDVPQVHAQRGAWVEVMGARTTIDDLTDRAGTIGYELLTRLGRRVHRVYQG